MFYLVTIGSSSQLTLRRMEFQVSCCLLFYWWRSWCSPLVMVLYRVIEREDEPHTGDCAYALYREFGWCQEHYWVVYWCIEYVLAGGAWRCFNFSKLKKKYIKVCLG
jgi:hypothetical protein